MTPKVLTIIVIFFFHFLVLGVAQKHTFPKGNPPELGLVSWNRNYKSALELAKASKKPILILFQEVPGCSNCTTFGNTLLSDPLIVEAIETYFVPLCIYNNKGGEDKATLELFGEQAWNNPVVRIVDTQSKNIVNRQPDFKSKTKLLNTIMDGMNQSGQKIPTYLQLLLEETNATEHMNKDEAYFSMYCFWKGEKELAGAEGILATEAGFMHGKEVVKVVFDHSKTNLSKLATNAQKVGCADQVYSHPVKDEKVNTKPLGEYQKDKDDKYYLSKSKYALIPMTDLQKTKVNRAIAMSQDAEIYLSPRQLKYLSTK